MSGATGSESTTSKKFDFDGDHGKSGSTGTDTKPEACDKVNIKLAQAPSNLMLVLDKSGSMVQNTWDHDQNEMTPKVTRWRSLYEVVKLVTTEFNASINFGAQLFPSAMATKSASKQACQTQSPPEVGVKAGNGAAILKAIPAADATVAVQGGTPATEAIKSAWDHLKTIPKGEGGAPVMVLVTDGAANCHDAMGACKKDDDTNPDCQSALFTKYDARLESVVSEAKAAGIRTYVIGIDIVDKPDDPKYKDPTLKVSTHEKLDAVAAAGGATKTGSKYYNVTQEKQLLTALQDIAGQVRTCVVDLQESGGSLPDRDQVPYVSFTVSGKAVPLLKGATSCEGQNGWRWVLNDKGEHAKVEMCGSYCQELKVSAKLDGEYGCPPPA